MLRARALVAFLMTIGVPATGLAHDPGLSALEVRVARMHLVADLSVAAQDVEHVTHGNTAIGIDALALRGIELFVDGRRLAARVQGVSHDAAGGVRITLTYERIAGNQLAIRSRIPQLFSRNHRQLLSICAEDGTRLAEKMLDAETGETGIDLGASGGVPNTALSFFSLGVAHILHGYDHLMFLAGLLVVARRTAEAVKAVTAFTIAHSITLALTVIGWAELPPAIVEPLIAASIVYVGAENLLLRAEMTRRWWLTFAFGLIHGFGFAGALRELGVGENGTPIAVPLASFNAGVEAGQVIAATAMVPILSRLRAHPRIGTRMATLGSVVVLLAGTYWLIARASILS